MPKLLPGLLVVLFAIFAVNGVARAFEETYLQAGVYCHDTDVALNIADRLSSRNGEEGNERARVALHIHRGRIKTVVMGNMFEGQPFKKVPVCECAVKTLTLAPKDLQGRGQVIRVSEHVRDYVSPSLIYLRPHVLIAGSQALCEMDFGTVVQAEVTR